MRRYQGSEWWLGLALGWLVVGCVFVSGTPLPICRKNADCELGAACRQDGSGGTYCHSCGGKTFCDDACIDTKTDVAHCGGCGKVCREGQACSGGACIAPTKAGEQRNLTVGGTVFAMRWIPAGSFTMGSPSSEPGRSSDEGPQQTVGISRGYWLMESEVTQGQYKALMGTNPSSFSSCGDHCPVEQVSWHDAALFANKASEKEGLPLCFACGGGECKGIGNEGSDCVGCEGWRLPTEAEWEYAARAGTTTAFHTGDCISTAQANCDGHFPQQDCPAGEYRQKTTAVCSLARNAWGLCDVHGNVWEWVMDWYDDSYHGLATRDPLRFIGRSNRVMRGGGWYTVGRNVRSASRGGLPPVKRGYSVGFRLLRY